MSVTKRKLIKLGVYICKTIILLLLLHSIENLAIKYLFKLVIKYILKSEIRRCVSKIILQLVAVIYNIFVNCEEIENIKFCFVEISLRIEDAIVLLKIINDVSSFCIYKGKSSFLIRMNLKHMPNGIFDGFPLIYNTDYPATGT